jgi:hypothetical protein
MHVVVFGSTGMVGQGVLREALLDPHVTKVSTVVRASSGQTNSKLHEIIHKDMTQLDGLDLRCDACFFAIGVTSAGMNEADYTKITYDTAIAAGRATLSPHTTFIFVSGQGAERDVMWAKVKRRAEKELLAMPFRGVYVFRPGFIRPLHGIRSRTKIYNALYAVLWPFAGLVPARLKSTTEEIGKAMCHIARKGFDKQILDPPDINRAAL